MNSEDQTPNPQKTGLKKFRPSQTIKPASELFGHDNIEGMAFRRWVGSDEEIADERMCLYLGLVRQNLCADVEPWLL